MICLHCHERLFLKGKLWYSCIPRPFPNAGSFTTKCARELGNHVAVEEEA